MDRGKKYDIGHGVIIVASHSGIRAKTETVSIGLGWPVNPPEDVELIESLDGKTYYPRNIGHVRFWMSKETFETEESAMDACPKGIFGPSAARFANEDGSTYYRYLLHFNAWDIKSKPGTLRVSKMDPLVFDFAGLMGNEWREQEAKFDEVIAFTGRNAREIISKIWPFEPDPEPEAIKI